MVITFRKTPRFSVVVVKDGFIPVVQFRLNIVLLYGHTMRLATWSKLLQPPGSTNAGIMTMSVDNITWRREILLSHGEAFYPFASRLLPSVGI